MCASSIGNHMNDFESFILDVFVIAWSVEMKNEKYVRLSRNDILFSDYFYWLIDWVCQTCYFRCLDIYKYWCFIIDVFDTVKEQFSCWIFELKVSEWVSRHILLISICFIFSWSKRFRSVRSFFFFSINSYFNAF